MMLNYRQLPLFLRKLPRFEWLTLDTMQKQVFDFLVCVSLSLSIHIYIERYKIHMHIDTNYMHMCYMYICSLVGGFNPSETY